MQAKAFAELQQQQLQRQLLAQQMLLQQQALAGNQVQAANKKQREVYVGNLAIGIITGEHLRELFNAVLALHVPDPVNNPPVINVNMDTSGRYGFVEMRSEELATTAMQLDKLELCGRPINVGRPKGYVEPPQGAASQVKLGLAQKFAAQLSGGMTCVVLMEGLMTVDTVRDEDDRRDLYDEVSEEASKCGSILGIAVPLPPPSVSGTDPCRVYVKFGSTADAQKCKEAMDGRMFDTNTIRASFVTEVDFQRANTGQWVDHSQTPTPEFPFQFSGSLQALLKGQSQ